MTTTNPTCKTCRWLEVPLDKAGKRVVRRMAYRCFAVVPDIKLPASVTMDYSFHWPLSRVSVWGTDGADCPCWKERT